MAIEIPTNTAIYIPVGPFLDKTDGITPELSITTANSAITLIAGAADETAPTIVLDSVAGNDGTNTLTHITNDDSGMYYLKLTAANNNRYGKGMLVIEDVDTYVTVFHEIHWVSAQYNSMKYGTTILNTNVTQVSGDSDAADNMELMFDGTGYAGGTTKLGVDAVAISGDTGAADALEDFFDDATSVTNLKAMFDGTGYAGGTAKLTVDLTKVLGTAITEGAAGRLAAALTKFLDVTSPVFTAASVNQGADNNTILSSATFGNSALKDLIDAITEAVITNAAGADVAADIIALKAVADLIQKIVRNKMEVVNATGAGTLYADDNSTPLLTNTITNVAGTTTRTRLE